MHQIMNLYNVNSTETRKTRSFDEAHELTRVQCIL